MNSREGKDSSWIHCNGRDINLNLKGGILKIHLNQVYLNSSKNGLWWNNLHHSSGLKHLFLQFLTLQVRSSPEISLKRWDPTCSLLFRLLKSSTHSTGGLQWSIKTWSPLTQDRSALQNHPWLCAPVDWLRPLLKLHYSPISSSFLHYFIYFCWFWLHSSLNLLSEETNFKKSPTWLVLEKHDVQVFWCPGKSIWGLFPFIMSPSWIEIWSFVLVHAKL